MGAIEQKMALLDGQLLEGIKYIEEEILKDAIFDFEAYSSFNKARLPYIIPTGFTFPFSYLSDPKCDLKCPTTRAAFSRSDLRINQAFVEILDIIDAYNRQRPYTSGTIDFSKLTYSQVASSTNFSLPKTSTEGTILHPREVIAKIKSLLVNPDGTYFKAPRVDTTGKTIECPEGNTTGLYVSYDLKPDNALVQHMQKLDAIVTELDELTQQLEQQQHDQETAELQLAVSLHQPPAFNPEFIEEEEDLEIRADDSPAEACRKAIAQMFTDSASRELFTKLYSSTEQSAAWSTLRDSNARNIFMVVISAAKKYKEGEDSPDLFKGLNNFIVTLPSKMPRIIWRTLCQETVEYTVTSIRTSKTLVEGVEIEVPVTETKAKSENIKQIVLDLKTRHGEIKYYSWLAYDWSPTEKVLHQIYLENDKIDKVRRKLDDLTVAYAALQNSIAAAPTGNSQPRQIQFAAIDGRYCTFRVIGQNELPDNVINKKINEVTQQFDTPAIVLSAEGKPIQVVIQEKGQYKAIELTGISETYPITQSHKLPWSHPIVLRVLNRADGSFTQIQNEDPLLMEAYAEYQAGKKVSDAFENKALIFAVYTMKKLRTHFSDEELDRAFTEKSIYPHGLMSYLLQDTNGINAAVPVSADGELIPNSGSATLAPWVIYFLNQVPKNVPLEDLCVSTLLTIRPSDHIFSILSLSERNGDEKGYRYRGLLVPTETQKEFKQVLFQRFGRSGLQKAAAELHSGSNETQRVHAVLYLSEQLSTSIEMIIRTVGNNPQSKTFSERELSEIQQQLQNIEMVMQITLVNNMLLTEEQATNLRNMLTYINKCKSQFLPSSATTPARAALTAKKDTILKLLTSIEKCEKQNNTNNKLSSTINDIKSEFGRTDEDNRPITNQNTLQTKLTEFKWLINISPNKMGIDFGQSGSVTLLSLMTQIRARYPNSELDNLAKAVSALIEQNKANGIFKAKTIKIIDELSKTGDVSTTQTNWQTITNALNNLHAVVDRLEGLSINLTEEQIDFLWLNFYKIDKPIAASNNQEAIAAFNKVKNLIHRIECRLEVDQLIKFLNKMPSDELMAGYITRINDLMERQQLTEQQRNSLAPLIRTIDKFSETRKVNILGNAPLIVSAFGLAALASKQQAVLNDLQRLSPALGSLVVLFNTGCRELMSLQRTASERVLEGLSNTPYRNARISNFIGVTSHLNNAATLNTQETAIIECYKNISGQDGVIQVTKILEVLHANKGFFESTRGKRAFGNNLLFRTSGVEQVLAESTSLLSRLKPGSVTQVVQPLRDGGQTSSSSPFNPSASSGADSALENRQTGTAGRPALSSKQN